MIHPGRIAVLILSVHKEGCEALAALLQQSGFEVKQVAMGADAKRLSLDKPDVILLDVASCDLGCLEQCYQITTDPITATIPVLPFSSGQPIIANQAQQATPLHPKALIAAIETLTRLRRAERFPGFLEAAPDAVVICDQKGTIVQVNAQVEKLFGYNSGELLGQTVEMLMPTRFRSRHIEHRAEYNANPRTRPMGSDLQLYGLRKNGDEFPCDISLSPLPNEGGFLITSITRDITAHRQLQDNLRTSNDKLERSFQALDRQFRTIGEIQRSLLPGKMPTTESMSLAVYYKPSERASGDYYDFFPLSDGQLGIFLGDVSGHGTPAAVMMAITHCIAHTRPGQAEPPCHVLEYLNFHLADKYTSRIEGFVTAFYGIFNPAARTFTYACAGHPSPRLKRFNGTITGLDGVRDFALGVDQAQKYGECTQQLNPGDQLIFYTDGLTDAFNQKEELFGLNRLNYCIENCSLQGAALLDSVLGDVEAFCEGRPADDDRTLIVATIS